MDMLSTAELTYLVESFMAVAFDDLLQEYLIFTAAVLAAVLPVLLAVLIRHRHKAYLYRDTTPMIFCHFIIFWLLLSAIKNLWDIHIRPSDFSGTGMEQPVEYAVGIVLLIAAVLVSIQLLRRKLSGPSGTILYIWLFAAFKNYRGIALAFWQLPPLLADTGTMYPQRPAPEQIMVYTIADYYITLAMTINFIALVLTAVLGVYFYHRRYIFLPNKLSGFPECSLCGKPVLKGDRHCRNCGTAVTVHPIADPVRSPLDKDHTCKECGTPLLSGVCITCALQGKKRTKKEEISDFLKQTGKMILIMLLVYSVYYFVMDGPKLLSQRNILSVNMLEASQEFSAQYNRLTRDIALARDPAWQNEFYAACDTLYAVDSRWSACPMRAIRSNDWVFYGSFGTASFEQMKVLEQIKEQIEQFIITIGEAGPVPEETAAEFWSVLDPLIIQFSDTVDAQENAQAHYEQHSYRYFPIESQMVDLFDGFRFYMLFINTKAVTAALLIISFCAAVYVLSFFCPKSALKIEKQYVTLQAENEERLQNFMLRYMEIPEWDRITSRSRRIFGSALPHMIRAAYELWVFLAAVATGIIVWLSLFRWQNIRRVAGWVWDGSHPKHTAAPQHTYKAYQKQKRKAFIKTIFWIGFFIMIIHIWTVTHPEKQDTVEAFMDVSGSVYWDNGPKINAYLITIGNAGTISPDAAQKLLVLIDDELTRIQLLREMSGDALQKKVDQKYPEYWSGVFSLSEMEEALLLDFQAQITAGSIPAPESVTQYAELGVEDFAWVYDLYHDYLKDQINNELRDIADSWTN